MPKVETVEMKDGWYPWVNRDGDQLGVLHYFEVGSGNPDNDDIEWIYRPLCGTGYPQAPNAWAVDDTPPFCNNTRCKRCLKKAPKEALA